MPHGVLYLVMSKIICTFADMKRLGYYITLLLVIIGCTTKGKYTMMRSGLDSINMLNRTYQPFTIADVEPYVHFFDIHGTSNDCMLAYYLLGRAYYDHGEAPMALKCYQQAVEHSDTTRDDCDYAQLSRVYAQMGNVFYAQSLYQEHLSHYQQAQRYAWMAKDTLAALSCYEQEAVAYKRLQKPDSALYAYEDIAKYYTQMNRPTDAAITLGGTLKILIESGSYEHAKRNMSIYESASGLFDQQGNIKKGKEIYYYLKGLSYLQEHRLDSAEYWFRKELHDGKDFNNQHAGAKGLAGLYHILHRPDSVAKYYQYAYEMNDSLYTNRTSKEIEQIQGMYNYSRNQGIAQRESERSARFASYLKTGVAVVIILLMLIYIIIYNYRQRIKQTRERYLQCLRQIEEAQADIIQLRNEDSGKEYIIAQKEKQIALLQAELRTYQKRKSRNGQEKQEAVLKASAAYQLFQSLSIKGQQPTEEDWHQLRTVVFSILPGFYQFMLSNSHSLNINEYNACILIRLHFKPADLCHMLNISSAYANKIRKTLLHKLFKKEGKAEDFDEIIVTLF